MKVRDIIAALEQDGWTLKATRGSHRQYVHPTKAGKVTVNGQRNDDVLRANLTSIRKQSGLKLR